MSAISESRHSAAMIRFNPGILHRGKASNRRRPALVARKSTGRDKRPKRVAARPLRPIAANNNRSATSPFDNSGPSSDQAAPSQSLCRRSANRQSARATPLRPRPPRAPGRSRARLAECPSTVRRAHCAAVGPARESAGRRPASGDLRKSRSRRTRLAGAAK